MVKGPVISVITVVLNNLDGLRKTADSLKFIKCDHEWIVIDGGSTDGTVDWLVWKNGDRLRWISEADAGIYDAMNKGWSLAVVEWVCFLNGGDYLIKCFDHLLSEHSEADMITGRVAIYHADGRPTGGLCPKLHWDRSDFITRCPIAHPATFLRRNLLYRFGPYKKNYFWVGDFEYWVRLHSQRAIIVFVEDVISGFQLGGISTQRNYVLKIEAERRSILCDYCYITKMQSFLMGIRFRFLFFMKNTVLLLLPVSVINYLRSIM